MEIAVPRDREGSFEPQLLAKGQRRFKEFDQRIIAMYSRGMTVREIQGLLEEEYGVEVSRDLISTVTEEVMDEVREWQSRPLEPTYAVVLFDALRVKIRDEGTVKNKAVHLALGTRVDGQKEVLGMWIEQNEGAKFWMKVLSELRNRGVNDMLMAVVDGLKGFPEAIRALYPQTVVQTCIVHLVRYSLSFCSYKDRALVAAELKKIYRAESAEAAERQLEQFELSAWGTKYRMIAQSWRRAWAEVVPFLSYAPEVRRVIYTTNAIESLHMQLRKVTKKRGHFSSGEAAGKLLYLALRNIMSKWTRGANRWKETALPLAIMFGERFTGNRFDGTTRPKPRAARRGRRTGRNSQPPSLARKPTSNYNHQPNQAPQTNTRTLPEEESRVRLSLLPCAMRAIALHRLPMSCRIKLQPARSPHRQIERPFFTLSEHRLRSQRCLFG